MVDEHKFIEDITRVWRKSCKDIDLNVDTYQTYILLFLETLNDQSEKHGLGDGVIKLSISPFLEFKVNKPLNILNMVALLTMPSGQRFKIDR